MSQHLTVMVALLRGVNVGGAGTMRMERLREVATAAGLERVQSYIQSGNLVFASPSGSAAAIGRMLRAAIAREMTLDPEVIVRTRSELAAVVSTSPLLTRGDDPANLHVVFMASRAAPSIRRIDLAQYRPEQVVAQGRELHLSLPFGAGRSKLVAELARHTGPHGTMRGWRTVTKLVEMADATV